jgi:hypothetical protein
LKTTVRHGWRTVWDQALLFLIFYGFMFFYKKCGGVWRKAPVPAVFADCFYFTE